ncbi:DNA-binding protein [Sphingomonas sp. NPDC079357]|uniref:DNA-binding protein n=1 Tax=Sphingomonas sp. NPDC079357 TaxID=3364518 RepID=UPI00384AF32C
MATVSMTKGAELVGVSKGTVSKALKSGRLSYAEKTDNGYLIDTSELFRVFPPKQPETVETGRPDTPLGNRETLMETGGLLREVELLREQLRDRDGVVDDLRQRLDKSEDERREAQARVIGLLAGPGPTESKRGFFGRLFGRPDE